LVSSRQSVLWRTLFAAITQPILLRMGPQPLGILLAPFWFLTYGLLVALTASLSGSQSASGELNETEKILSHLGHEMKKRA
jgi:hypothetical protein